MKHLPLKELGYALAFVLLPAGLYVGAYYAMVESAIEDVNRGNLTRVPTYRFGTEPLAHFFDPMHQVDRKLRPAAWQPAIWEDVLAR